MAALRYDWKASTSYGTLGLEVVISILVGLGGGIWIDSKLETSPGFTIAGMVFGFAAAVRAVWVAAKRMRKETEDDDFRDAHADRPAILSVRARLKRLAEIDGESARERTRSAAPNEPSAAPGAASVRPRRRARRGSLGPVDKERAPSAKRRGRKETDDGDDQGR